MTYLQCHRCGQIGKPEKDGMWVYNHTGHTTQEFAIPGGKWFCYECIEAQLIKEEGKKCPVCGFKRSK